MDLSFNFYVYWLGIISAPTFLGVTRTKWDIMCQELSLYCDKSGHRVYDPQKQEYCCDELVWDFFKVSRVIAHTVIKVFQINLHHD